MPADRVTEAAPAPEDAVVIAEVLRRLADAVGSIGQRADGNVNHADLYRALNDAYQQAYKETLNGAIPPADPVVSPADTIRRARNRIAARGQHDLVGLADLADALLAVGERDRRHIARLTEALEQIAVEIRPSTLAASLSADQHVAALWEVVRHYSATARAVLADEEDARPGLPVAVEEAIERHDADRADEALAALCEATREDVQDLEAFSGGVFDCCPVCGKLANEHPPRAAGEGDT